MADDLGLEDLRERLTSHSNCFNSLLKLVPPKYYFTDGQEEPDGKFFKNKKNKCPKQTVKEATKKAKLARLDPSKHKSVIELQIESSINSGKLSINEHCVSVEDVECSNIEDLRTKLHKHIELQQRKRKAPNIKSGKHDRPTKQTKKKVKSDKNEKNINSKLSKLNGKELIGNKKQITNNDGKVVFSKFDFTSDVTQTSSTGKKEKKNYKKLLEKAEDRKKKLEEMKVTDIVKASNIVKQEAWKKAFGKSEGLKQKDDAGLLRKAVKRKEKLKGKHQKEWKERMDNQKKQIKEKQQHRQKNIRERIDSKKKKKMKKGGRTPGF